jgi:hypothetical protein
MKTSIAKYFYDKGILVMTKTQTRDSEGGLKNGSNKVNYKFYGNVSFSNFGTIQENYGLDYKIDISITASPENFEDKVYLGDAELVYETDRIYIKQTGDLVLGLDDIISYAGKEYRVTNIIPSDSHILILGQWKR